VPVEEEEFEKMEEVKKAKKFLIEIDEKTLEEMKDNAEFDRDGYSSKKDENEDFIYHLLGIQPDQHIGIGHVVEFDVKVTEVEG
jgi:hypothetical protein